MLEVRRYCQKGKLHHKHRQPSLRAADNRESPSCKFLAARAERATTSHPSFSTIDEHSYGFLFILTPLAFIHFFHRVDFLVMREKFVKGKQHLLMQMISCAETGAPIGNLHMNSCHRQDRKLGKCSRTAQSAHSISAPAQCSGSADWILHTISLLQLFLLPLFWSVLQENCFGDQLS